MAILPTWKIAELKMSVDINGVFISLKEAKHSLRRFVRPFALYNEGSDPLTELSIKGSSHLINYKGRLILLATQHQLKDDHDGQFRSIQEIVLVANQTSDDPKHLLTGSEATKVKYPPEADFKAGEDIVILEFTPAKYTVDPTDLFWKISATNTLSNVSAGHVDLIFTIGFPSEATDYDYEFDEELGTGEATYSSKPRLLYLNLLPDSDLEFHRAFSVHEKSKATVKDLDGFSGAPVFFIHHDTEHNYFVGYAGMIARGGNSKLHLYDADEIFKLLDGA